MSQEEKHEVLTVKETTLTGDTIFRRISARITGLFDWRQTHIVGGERGHIEITGNYQCSCGALVNVRDRKAKRHHPKGHKR